VSNKSFHRRRDRIFKHIFNEVVDPLVTLPIHCQRPKNLWAHIREAGDGSLATPPYAFRKIALIPNQDGKITMVGKETLRVFPVAG
jgi:hypothetical protein